MKDIKITLNGRRVTLSKRDSNKRLAHKMAKVALTEINAHCDPSGEYRTRLIWWQEVYEAKLDAAYEWWRPEAVMLRRLGIDNRYRTREGQRKLRIEERIWTLRKLVALEVLNVIAELLK